VRGIRQGARGDPLGRHAIPGALHLARRVRGARGGGEQTDFHDLPYSGGKPLDSDSRAFLEPRFGRDFSRVRVHADSRAAERAKAINALAFTVGQNIHFGAGQFDTESESGMRLIAHELAHTIQQKSIDAGRSSSADKLTTKEVLLEYEGRPCRRRNSRRATPTQHRISPGVGTAAARCGQEEPTPGSEDRSTGGADQGAEEDDRRSSPCCGDPHADRIFQG